MQREDLIDTDIVKVSTIKMAPGEQSPWHYHTHIQESVFCLTGELVVSNDMLADITLMPGERIDFNPGQQHSLHNRENQPASYLLVQHGRYDFIECEPPYQLG